MRALRDFNWPKIIVDDRNIFLGLIRDLSPGIDAEPKINETLNKAVETVTRNAGLQPEEGFILKCV
jgi:dynein heavy chain